MHCAVFATGVVAALIWQQRSATAPVTAAATPLPANTLDLRDPEVRQQISRLARYGRAAGSDWNKSLFRDCDIGQDDTYAVLKSYSFSQDEYVEIRRSNSGGATALRWPGKSFVDPPPLLPPARTPASAAAQPAELRDVSTANFEAIEAAFLALAQEQVVPIRGEMALDGGSITLEYCRGGQYGLFQRMNPDDRDSGDRRVAELGFRMLELAGVRTE